MTVQNSGGDETLEKYTSLPGEVYDADSQCRHIIGPGSSFCTVRIEECKMNIWFFYEREREREREREIEKGLNQT